MYTLFFIYFRRVTILPFRPFVFLLMYSNNGTPFDTSAYYTDGVILYNIIIIIIIFVRLVEGECYHITASFVAKRKGADRLILVHNNP